MESIAEASFGGFESSERTQTNVKDIAIIPHTKQHTKLQGITDHGRAYLSGEIDDDELE